MIVVVVIKRREGGGNEGGCRWQGGRMMMMMGRRQGVEREGGGALKRLGSDTTRFGPADENKVQGGRRRRQQAQSKTFTLSLSPKNEQGCISSISGGRSRSRWAELTGGSSSLAIENIPLGRCATSLSLSLSSSHSLLFSDLSISFSLRIQLRWRRSERMCSRRVAAGV